jgi:predicted esterase
VTSAATVAHPHGGGPVLTAGPPPEEARLAVVLLHGRGAGARDILGLAGELELEDAAFLAPEARHATWYPSGFMSPLAVNEPSLSSALRRIGEVVAELEKRGLPAERIVLLGFSQGACLALEFVARSGRRWGGVVAFSGGVIGPPDRSFEIADGAAGALGGTPIFLGCSDRDPHIPLRRVEESAAFLRRLGAAVDLRIYPGMPHTVNEDEIVAARKLLAEVG